MRLDRPVVRTGPPALSLRAVRAFHREVLHESSARVGGETDAIAGLTSAAAMARLVADGPNIVVPVPGRTRWRRRLGPFADPMVALLLVAAPTYLAIGAFTDAVVAFVAVGPIAAVGWALEARAERTLDAMRRLAAPAALVIRDGREQKVATFDVVVGDIVVVHEGDVVPADSVLRRSTQILLDESPLTGESMPIGKSVGAAGDDACLWAGTTVLSGRAVVEVTATGSSTRCGRIGRLVADTEAEHTPFQRGLLRLVRSLVVLAFLLCAAVVVAELLNGGGWAEAVIAGVSLAIAAIPEEFSMVYTLYLALGAWRLTRDHALVRRLPSVETLGSTTVICTDKTGTLTEGHLALVATWTPDGGIRNLGREIGSAEEELLESAVLACEPRPFDRLDRVVVDTARDHGVDVDRLLGGRLVTDWPFEPTDRYVTHVWAVGPDHPDDPMRVVAAKGSIEGIARHTVDDPSVLERALAANEAFTARGMRVIAVAVGAACGPGTGAGRDDDEAGLRLCGLIAFRDRVREGVAEALSECRRAGIRVIMMTGDHPETARSVAEEIGLVDQSAGATAVATGDDLDRADPDRLDHLVGTASVFARVRPEHKHLLVAALRRRGEVVAMTGDGINDAPALREADIGVAMGARGTTVARESASMVLLDDNFTTIVGAVRGGRRIFDNLTRAFSYLIAFHPPLLLGALVVPLLDRPLLLLPVHLVVLELVLHPIVSLVFQADPAAPDAMSRPPLRVGEALRLRAMVRPYAVGLVLAAVVLTLYLVLLARWPEDQARALAFATLLASQPVLLLSFRSPDRPFWRCGAPWTRTLVVVNVLLVVVTAAVVEVGPVAELLHLSPFPDRWWPVAIAAAATTAWSEPLKPSAFGRRARHDATRTVDGP